MVTKQSKTDSANFDLKLDQFFSNSNDFLHSFVKKLKVIVRFYLAQKMHIHFDIESIT